MYEERILKGYIYSPLLFAENTEILDLVNRTDRFIATGTHTGLLLTLGFKIVSEDDNLNS